MFYSWPLLNPGHIGVIGIPKWRLFDVNPETPFSPFFNLDGYLTPNVDINLVLEIYTKLSSIWYVKLYDWIDKCERERPLSDAESSWRRDIDRWGEFIFGL